MSNLRGDRERQRSPERTSNQEAGVQPRGSGEIADSPVARRKTEGPMFGEQLMEEISPSVRGSSVHSTLANRHGTDPYAWWCGRGRPVRASPIPRA